MNHAGPQDEEVVIGRGAVRDVRHESLEVFEAAGLTCGLRSPTPMADSRVVANVPRGVVVGGHVRMEPLDLDDIVGPVDDHRFSGIDPHQGA
jgi:hypothetical protein